MKLRPSDGESLNNSTAAVVICYITPWSMFKTAVLKRWKYKRYRTPQSPDFSNQFIASSIENQNMFPRKHAVITSRVSLFEVSDIFPMRGSAWKKTNFFRFRSNPTATSSCKSIATSIVKHPTTIQSINPITEIIGYNYVACNSLTGAWMIQVFLSNL